MSPMTPKATVSLEELRDELITDFSNYVMAQTSRAIHKNEKEVAGFIETLDAYREAAVMAERLKIADEADKFKWTQSHPSGALYEFGQYLRGSAPLPIKCKRQGCEDGFIWERYAGGYTSTPCPECNPPGTVRGEGE